MSEVRTDGDVTRAPAGEVTVDDSGRVIIPARIHTALGIDDGEFIDLYIVPPGGGEDDAFYARDIQVDLIEREPPRRDKARVTLPPDKRRAHDLEPGDKVSITVIIPDEPR